MEDMTRKDFERNFHLLQERMLNGQMQFSNNVQKGIESLKKIKYLPNGRIDFLTVDESARCLVNTVMYFDSEEFKERFKK